MIYNMICALGWIITSLYIYIDTHTHTHTHIYIYYIYIYIFIYIYIRTHIRVISNETKKNICL